jgi:hypothetical protein
MARAPLGVYTRTSGDWFQHKRSVASGSFTIQSGGGGVVGLVNLDQGGRVCHVLGVTIAGWIKPDAVNEIFAQGFYYTPPASPFILPDSILSQNLEAFFDLDPVPMMGIDIGYSPRRGFPPTCARMIPLFNSQFQNAAPLPAPSFNYFSAQFFPPGGVAAFKSTRAFGVVCGDWPNADWFVSFDFVMLPD